jgi:ABC-type multidrug transport system fused ATPase/permease subunit
MSSKLAGALSNFEAVSALRILGRRDKVVISVISAIQMVLGLLDLLGVALIGALGALAVNGVQSRPPGNRVNTVLRFLRIEDFTFQQQALVFGVVAAVVLVLKTILSIYFTRKIMFYMSRKGAEISGQLVRKLLSTNLFIVQGQSTQKAIYAMNGGVTALTMGFIATAIGMLADTSLLILLTIGLFVIDPLIALSTIIIFALIGILLYALQQLRAKELGLAYSKLDISVNQRTIEAISTYRELLVRGIRDDYALRIGELQLSRARNQAEITFMPQISKYVMEISIVIAALGICWIQFFLTDATRAVATLAVFLAAGSRIAPAVLRLQQGAISIRGNLSASKPTLKMIEILETYNSNSATTQEDASSIQNFNPKVEISNLTVIYPGSEEPAIQGCTLEISAGQIVAIVGPSGAGKTSLVDALLGVLPISVGHVRISGKTPLNAISSWPGSISYVPQEVSLSNSTIDENIRLGAQVENPDSNMMYALDKSQLTSFISTLPHGIQTQIGERGSKLSGGQRQRIGIARAYYTKPKLLILDESTSALDSETESLISNSILELRKEESTVIMIAHRLSTVRMADLVVYMSNGRIIASGNMEEVRKKVPDFDRQASLMGI